MPTIGETFYLAFPVFRDVFATAKGVVLNRQRYGAHYRAAVPQVRERSGWTPAQISEYQTRRLRHVVEIAGRHVPYYRELFQRLGISARDIRDSHDLRHLPILEKDAVRANPLQFLDERLSPEALLEDTTTGTTGTPIRVLMTRKIQQAHYAYFEARCRQVAGLQYGKHPFATFGVRRVVSLKRQKAPFWCYNFAGNQLYMSVYHLAPQYLRHYCQELKRRPYQALIGFPSALSALAQYALDENIHDLKIPIAITSGEILQPRQRSKIEQAFGSRVFDQFGCAEMAVFASEGPCRRMHVSLDYGIVEIVNGKDEPVAPGQTGELICTGLVNDAQVFLRYRLGDMVSLDEGRCECGSMFPVFSSLDGRAAHAIILADGRKLFRMSAIDADVPSVKEYQIVQEAIGIFTFNVVPAENFCDADKQKLIANLIANVGPADVRIQLVDQIVRGRGGKFASILSNVRPSETPHVLSLKG